MSRQEHDVAVGVVDVGGNLVEAVLIEHDVVVELLKHCQEEVHGAFNDPRAYLSLNLTQVLQALVLDVFSDLETFGERGLVDVLLNEKLHVCGHQSVFSYSFGFLSNDLTVDKCPPQGVEVPPVVLANDKLCLAARVNEVLLPHVPLDALQVEVDSVLPAECLRINIESLSVFGTHHGLKFIYLLGLVDPLVHRKVLEQVVQII